MRSSATALDFSFHLFCIPFRHCGEGKSEICSGMRWKEQSACWGRMWALQATEAWLQSLEKPFHFSGLHFSSIKWGNITVPREIIEGKFLKAKQSKHKVFHTENSNLVPSSALILLCESPIRHLRMGPSFTILSLHPPCGCFVNGMLQGRDGKQEKEENDKFANRK